MEKSFVTHSSLKIPDLKDAIAEKMCKAKGVLNCLIFALEFAKEDDKLDDGSAFHALWVVDEYLAEINDLQQTLNAKIN